MAMGSSEEYYMILPRLCMSKYKGCVKELEEGGINSSQEIETSCRSWQVTMWLLRLLGITLS